MKKYVKNNIWLKHSVTKLYNRKSYWSKSHFILRKFLLYLYCSLNVMHKTNDYFCNCQKNHTLTFNTLKTLVMHIYISQTSKTLIPVIIAEMMKNKALIFYNATWHTFMITWYQKFILYIKCTHAILYHLLYLKCYTIPSLC